MAVLNYTTTIDAHKSVGEIQRLLAAHGVRGVLVGYDAAGNPITLAFEIGAADSVFRYQLPCRHHAVWSQLQRDPRTSKAQRTEAQALRVAWRILKDWVEAQMAIVEAQMVDLHEVFFAYSLTDNGQTMYERSIALLTGPTESKV